MTQRRAPIGRSDRDPEVVLILLGIELARQVLDQRAAIWTSLEDGAPIVPEGTSSSLTARISSGQYMVSSAGVPSYDRSVARRSFVRMVAFAMAGVDRRSGRFQELGGSFNSTTAAVRGRAVPLIRSAAW